MKTNADLKSDKNYEKLNNTSTNFIECMDKQYYKSVGELVFEELNENNIKIAAKVQYEIFPDSSAYFVYKSKVTGERENFYVSYIVYLNNEPMGVVGLYEIPEYSDTIWLSWFGVIKKYRKMGLGKQMLDFIIEVAKKLNKNF